MKTSTRFGRNFFIPLLLLLWLLLNANAYAATSVYVDDGGCAGNTPCFTSIQAGVNNAGPGASTIFIFPGSYDESVDISQMGSMSGGLGDLTLRAVSASGQPAISGVAINSSSGEAIFNSVDPFPNSLTLIGINVSSQTTDGIDIEGLLGAVRLDNMDAIGSFYDGIDLRTSGAITLNNINASGNGTDGIELLTEDAGDITLTDVIANGNGLNQPEDGDGVVIDIHDGAIVFERVDASNNSDDGIRIWPNNIPTGPDSWDFGVIDSIVATEVTTNMNGLGLDEGNGQGFRVTNRERGLNPTDAIGRVGDITIANSESNGNNQTGYNLEGATIGSIFISDTSAIGNGSEGFQIQPFPGEPDDNVADPVQFIPLVELTRVQAIDNVDDGFQIEVAGGGGEDLTSSIGTIRLTDVASIRNGLDAGGENPSDGFELEARISLEMTRVSAIGNGTDGIQIGATPSDEAVLQGESRGVPQTITGTDITLIGNGRDNIEADAFGDITLRRIVANDSIGDPDFPPAPDSTGTDGIELQTWAGGDILLEDCQANNNLAGDGLDLNARAGGGAITVRRCEASSNFSDGIDIAKANSEDGVLNDSANTNTAVLIEDVRMENNGDDGCQPQSLGPITINRACIIGNQSSGLFVMRTGASLTINDSIAENNVADGMCLRDLSGGSYTVSNTDIFGNAPGLLSASEVTIEATNLFWGSASGPTHPGNAGTGDEVIDSANGGLGTVNYTPFATASVTGGAACDVVFDVNPAQPIPPQRLIGEVQVVSSTSLWAEILLLLTVLGLGVFVLRRAI